VTTATAVTYTITIQNAGPDAAPGIALAITAPAGASVANISQGSCTNAAGAVNCAIGTLASSGSATVTLSVTPANAGTLTVQANVTTTGADRVPANNSAQQTTTVNAPPPSGGGGGGGGGGGVGCLFLLCLAWMLAMRRANSYC